MKKTVFDGVATALITPFYEGKTDIKAFEKMILRQLESNVDAIVVCGTTGEASTLSDDEHIELIKTAVSVVDKKIPVIAGTGSNCTAHAIKMTERAELSGADAVLCVTPYYNKCNQNGLYLHYAAIARCTALPVILYNVPSRTGVNIETVTAKKLSEIENIVAIKETVNDIDKLRELSEYLDVYSGNDEMFIDVLSNKGKGIISVASNVIPDKMKNIYKLYINGKTDLCKNEFSKLLSLFDLMFCDINPQPVKYMCSVLGLCRNELRLPLTKINVEISHKIYKEMKKMNII